MCNLRFFKTPAWEAGGTMARRAFPYLHLVCQLCPLLNQEILHFGCLQCEWLLSVLHRVTFEHHLEVAAGPECSGILFHFIIILLWLPNSHTMTLTVCNATSSNHVTPLFCTLHMLPAEFQVWLKVLLITYKTLHSIKPSYLWDHLSLITSSMTDQVDSTSLMGLLLFWLIF